MASPTGSVQAVLHCRCIVYNFMDRLPKNTAVDPSIFRKSWVVMALQTIDSPITWRDLFCMEVWRSLIISCMTGIASILCRIVVEVTVPILCSSSPYCGIDCRFVTYTALTGIKQRIWNPECRSLRFAQTIMWYIREYRISQHQFWSVITTRIYTVVVAVNTSSPTTHIGFDRRRVRIMRICMIVFEQ